jgi:hypothetical protein
LQALRGELRRELALQQKSSLYAALGASADCDDAALAAAIERSSSAGGPPSAELRYAIDTLGRPESREAYDRHLLEQLRRPKPELVMHAPAPSATRSPWVVPVMAGIFGLLLLGGAWLALDAMKANAEREMRRLEAEARAEESRRRAEAIPKTSELMRRAVEASAEAQKREADAKDKAVEEAKASEERFRDERDKRYQQDLARDEKLRQDYEKSQQDRANRELLNAMTGSAARGALGGR